MGEVFDMQAMNLHLNKADSNISADLLEIFLSARSDSRSGIPSLSRSNENLLNWISETLIAQKVTWIASADSEILGFITFSDHAIDQLYVHPEYQNKGVGSELIELAKLSMPSGIKLYTFQSNLRALNFYEKNGFQELQRSDGQNNEEKSPDVLLSWHPQNTSNSIIRVIQIEDAGQILEITKNFREKNLYSTCLLSAELIRLSKTPDKRFKYFVVAKNGDVLGMALQHPFMGVLTSPMNEESSLLLAQKIAANNESLPSIYAPLEVMRGFQKAWKSEGDLVIVEKQLVMMDPEELSGIDSKGSIGLCEDSDYENLLEKFLAYAAEVVDKTEDPADYIRSLISTKSVFCLRVEGVITTFVAFSSPVLLPEKSLVTLGPIYTLPEYRRSGHATFATAEVSKYFLSQGIQPMLYTDESNPTSNRIYESIGYRHNETFSMREFKDHDSFN